MSGAHHKRTAGLTVAVGMSGGVDSGVTAWLLKQQGYNVIGLTMSIWDPKQPFTSAKRSACYGPGEADDIAAAQATAERLGIPHHTVTLADEYDRQVLDAFRSQNLAGLTPNPCALCNPIMKFGLLPARARALGIPFDFFATGHYARIVRDETAGRFRLLRGVDASKDQSYFLARLTQTQLAEILFPLGGKTKQEVRALAREARLDDLNEKPESQDFFEGDDISILFNGAGTEPGPIVDTTGRVLGQHRGIIHYTVGQRDGLGIAVGRKVYVKEIRAATNTLVVDDREGVLADACRVADMQWIAGEPPDATRPITARLRYRHKGVMCRFTCCEDGTLELRFDEPQFAVTPGQMAALYDGDDVLGGGWIRCASCHTA
ncbi:MAG TPA: tRNA 2-thiouridine(34) synthase MnmA [Kiritimatiellia bacterium]|nr:tRNA 2-thiouridine(34) synthase MnmA [Kiritimatiellia bacterium]HRU70593.1 tRNA 2-thiouridine(34) synthase MnmA [Kiritimatiellia bacterium]